MTASPRHAAWIAPGVALAGLVLYLLTLSQGPYPGQSAQLMAGQLGASPMDFNLHWLWDLVCRGVVAVPLGPVATRLNVASALCAAGALWLLVRLVRSAILMTIEVDDRNRRAAVSAAGVGGVAAGLFLAVSLPFWYVANRFHVAAFDLVLLLGLSHLLLSFMRDPLAWKGLVFGLAYGLATVEFPSLVIFSPLAMAAVLLALRMHGELRWGRVLPVVGCLLAGLLAYGLTAWRFLGSESFLSMFATSGYGRALYTVLKMHYGLVVRSLPQLGWLLVIIVGIVPWLAVLLVGRRGLNAEKDWGLYILHLLLTGLTLGVLFNAPFAPWALLGPWRLIVTPYLLLAVVFGYLAAYWFLLPRMYMDDEENPAHLRWRERVGWIPALVLLALPLAAGALHFRASDARAAGAVNGYARAVVESIGDRPWLLTDGVFDDNILVAAREAGRTLRPLNLRYANHPPYLSYVGRQFEDPRLRGLAELDLFAFLREWMTVEARFTEKVAFLTLPDLWLSAGFQPIPDRVCFRGGRALSEVDPQSLWEAHRDFWNRPFIAGLSEARRDRMIAPLAGYALRHLSMVANNTGVVLEDLGWQQQAFAAYAQARQLDKDNISALLNQATMIDRGHATPDKDRIQAELKTMSEGLKNKIQVWALARTYGYVRIPQAYADMGMVWALSGEPGMAVAGFKKAIELEPGARDQLTYGLAAAYLAQDQSQEGEALYRGLLEKNPADVRALVGLARLLALGGKFEEAGALLERAGKAGVPKERIAMEYAALHLAAGDLSRARIVLQELTELKPELSTAWAMLAAVLMQQKDTQALIDCERKLDRIKDKDFIVLFILGQIAVGKGDYAGARVLFDKAHVLRPSNPLVLEQLLGLDIRENREDLAGLHVRNLLLIDPEHAFANQVLGSLQLKRLQYGLAESSLRKSVARRRTPEALNDLAWVLQARGQLEEAESLVREALKADDRSSAMWDTLGVILMKRGALDEAETALKKSVSLYADDPGVQVHLAELYAAKGDRARAAELATALLARGSELTASDREKLRKLVRRP